MGLEWIKWVVDIISGRDGPEKIEDFGKTSSWGSTIEARG